MKIAVGQISNTRVIGVVTLFNLHVKTGLLCASNVKSSVTTRLLTLYTRAHITLLTNEAAKCPSKKKRKKRPIKYLLMTLALVTWRQAYLPGEILSIFSRGSKKIRLAKTTSGIQRPQTTWAHRSSEVFLKAPPVLGQRQQETGSLGECKHLRQSQDPSGIYGTPQHS